MKNKNSNIPMIRSLKTIPNPVPLEQENVKVVNGVAVMIGNDNHLGSVQWLP